MAEEFLGFPSNSGQPGYDNRSGFRTMEQQRVLYQKYLNGTGNLAAQPGYSNHQGGIATDISVGSTASKTYKWLAANASKYGFVRTVPSEPWHWEYRKESPLLPVSAPPRPRR